MVLSDSDDEDSDDDDSNDESADASIHPSHQEGEIYATDGDLGATDGDFEVDEPVQQASPWYPRRNWKRKEPTISDIKNRRHACSIHQEVPVRVYKCAVAQKRMKYC